jgi:2-dehydropantoate 2-reductase
MVAAMTDGRFTLATPSGPLMTKLPALTDLTAEAIRHDSVILLSVKAQHVPATIAVLRPIVPPATPIVCLQNGVRAEGIAAESFQNVYGALNVLSSIYLRDGEVRTAYDPPAAAWLEIGRYPSGLDETCGRLVQGFRTAGIVALRNDQVMAIKYAKLLGNLSNAARAIADAQVPTVWRWALAEGEEVLRHAGVAVAPMAAIEDRTTFLQRCSPPPLVNLGSTWQSLMRGVDTEVDFLNGEIVRIAAAHGQTAPVNQVLVELIHEMEARRAPPGYLTPAQLEEACRRRRDER